MLEYLRLRVPLIIVFDVLKRRLTRNDLWLRVIGGGVRLVVLCGIIVALFGFGIVDDAGRESRPERQGRRPGLIEQYQVGGQVWSLCFSADGNYLASATITGEVMVKAFVDGHVLRLQDGPVGCVRSLAFSPRGGILAYANGESAVRFWDIDSRAELAALETGGERTRWFAFSPDGVMLAVGEWSGAAGGRTVSVWDWKSGRRLALLSVNRGGIKALAFSPDGKQLAVGDSSGAFTLWDCARWCLSATIQAHAPGQGGVSSLAFSPTCGVLATAGCLDPIVRLWKSTGSQLLATFTPTDYVNELGFSPAGTMIATAQSDGCVGVWDCATGRQLGSIPSAGRGLHSIAFSGDGRLLATGDFDGIVRVWDIQRVLDSERHLGPVAAVKRAGYHGRHWRKKSRSQPFRSRGMKTRRIPGGEFDPVADVTQF